MAPNSGYSPASVLMALGARDCLASSSWPQPLVLLDRINQSQNYFTTGGLPPVSSSWLQPLETHDQGFYFCNWTLAMLVLMQHPLWWGWVCLLWIWLALVKCTCRTYSMLLKILPFALHWTELIFLFVFAIETLGGPSGKHHFQQFLYCCVCICGLGIQMSGAVYRPLFSS
jgi:hypothetical protein